MRPNIEEALRFFRLASGDLVAFSALAQHPEVSHAIACFHAQQCVEKSLKAVLFLRGVGFRRTHDLEELMTLLDRQGIPLPLPAAEISALSPCAVAVRYDEDAVPSLPVREMGRVAQSVHAWAKGILPSPSQCIPSTQEDADCS